MKPRPTSFAIPILFNPVTERNITDMACKLPVTERNIMNISPATKRNKSDIAPVTVCNISELKRTKPPCMTEPINYKPLKMNTSPQPKNMIFETHQKPVTKRNKRELWRTNSHVFPWGDRGASRAGQKTPNPATLRQHFVHTATYDNNLAKRSQRNQ